MVVVFGGYLIQIALDRTAIYPIVMKRVQMQKFIGWLTS